MLRFATIVLGCALLSACGTGQVRRVSEPAANIQQLTVRADGNWSVDVRLDNFSSIPMRFDSVGLALIVGGEAAGTLQGRPGLTIGPEAADVATLAFTPSASARIVVADALARGHDVAYSLEGTLDATPEDGGQRHFRFHRSNRLSPVPGLPGVLR